MAKIPFRIRAHTLGILGILSVVAGILYVVNAIACILSLSGTKDPSKIKPFFYIVAVLTALQAIHIIGNVIYGDISSNRFLALFCNNVE